MSSPGSVAWRGKTPGVYFIFKSMEQGASFRVSVSKYPSKDANYRILAPQRSRLDTGGQDGDHYRARAAPVVE